MVRWKYQKLKIKIKESLREVVFNGFLRSLRSVGMTGGAAVSRNGEERDAYFVFRISYVVFRMSYCDNS